MRAKDNSSRAASVSLSGNTTSTPVGVRNEYADHPEGATGWYRDHGSSYRNPHTPAVDATMRSAVEHWPELFGPPGRILDFCCGSGEVTRALIGLGVDGARIDATDPFTHDAFEALCSGRSLLANWTFADVERGAAQRHRWTTVVCSYAFHLCEQSRLAGVCLQLAAVADHLVIVTPHKRPELRETWGFTLHQEVRDTALRVRLRRFDAVTLSPA